MNCTSNERKYAEGLWGGVDTVLIEGEWSEGSNTNLIAISRATKKYGRCAK